MDNVINFKCILNQLNPMDLSGLHVILTPLHIHLHFFICVFQDTKKKYKYSEEFILIPYIFLM